MTHSTDVLAAHCRAVVAAVDRVFTVLERGEPISHACLQLVGMSGEEADAFRDRFRQLRDDGKALRAWRAGQARATTAEVTVARIEPANGRGPNNAVQMACVTLQGHFLSVEMFVPATEAPPVGATCIVMVSRALPATGGEHAP